MHYNLQLNRTISLWGHAIDLTKTFKFHARWNATRRLRSVCRNFMCDNENAMDFCIFVLVFLFYCFITSLVSFSHSLSLSYLYVCPFFYSTFASRVLYMECAFQLLVPLIDVRFTGVCSEFHTTPRTVRAKRKKKREMKREEKA